MGKCGRIKQLSNKTIQQFSSLAFQIKKNMPNTKDLTNKTILIFWLPLAATWLLMSVEGPFLASVIARMDEPKFNLAAYGVAFSFALIVEAPVIMLMSAENSFKKLRNFT